MIHEPLAGGAPRTGRPVTQIKTFHDSYVTTWFKINYLQKFNTEEASHFKSNKVEN
jgi:hypothetical protein